MIANGSDELRQWTVSDCSEAVRFYVQAFAARELTRACLPDGHLVAAEVEVGPYLLSLTEQSGTAEDDLPVWVRPALPLGCPDLEQAILLVVTAGGAFEFGSGGRRGRAGIAVRDPVGRRWLLHQQDPVEAAPPARPPGPAAVQGSVPAPRGPVSRSDSNGY